MATDSPDTPDTDDDHDAPAGTADDTAPVTVDDAPAPAPPPTLTREDLASARRSRWFGPLLLGASALLLVGFIAGRLTAPEDGTTSVDEVTVPPLTFPRGDQDRSGYWGFGGVTPVITDTFGRPDDPTSLGTTDTGATWDAIGTWGIAGGQARTDDVLAVATVAGGNPDRLTEATLMVVEEGAGITFRFQDPDNHWRLTAAPSRQVWELTRVLDGEATVVGEVGAAVEDGVTIGVAQRGTELQVLIDGADALRVTDAALAQQARSGLVTVAGEGGARWDRFYVGNMPTAG